MPADGLTKTLSRQRFEQFRALLNMVDIKEKNKPSNQDSQGTLIRADQEHH